MSRSVIKGLKLKSVEGRLNPSEIAEAIEKGLLAQRRPAQEFTQKKTFSPSTIGYGHGTCARYWYLAFTGTPDWQDEVDAMGVANMGVGSMVHDYIQAALKSSGLVIEEETEITMTNPPIRGFLDAVVNWNDEELVCEIKTTRQETFILKEASGKPSPNHLIQLLIYLKATGRRRGFLLYVNKNDQSYLVIPVELNEANEAIITKVFAWLEETRKAFDDGQLPIIPFTRARNSGEPSNKICRNCPVRKDCFDQYQEGDITIPLMEVPTP